MAILVVLEIGLRLTLGLGSPPLLIGDPDIGYLFKPGQDVRRFGSRVHINRWCQRSADVADAPPAPRSRVLVVGDSVSWGGVQMDQSETWPELVGAQLSAALGRHIEVLNASAGSWGIGNEWAYVRRYGTFGSSVVILQIGSHDLTQNKSRSERVGRAADMPDRPPLLALGELFSRYLVAESRSASAAAPAGLLPPDESFRQNMMWLGEELQYLRGAGAQVVVLHTPDRAEVVQRPAVDAQGSRRREFLSLVSGRAAQVVDLTALWAGRPGVAALYYDSIHPNRRGAREIAATLVPVVEPLLH